MSRRFALLFGTCLLAVAAAKPARAAQFVIRNADGPSEGLNDPTPVLPVGGNSAVTAGAQRLAVLRAAAASWSAALSTVVDVNIEVSFDALPCDALTAVLGQGGPTSVSANFSGSIPDTWYPIGLANQVAGSDLNGATAELELQLNQDLGGASCLSGHPFYLGLDGAAPADTIDLFSVAIHELAHGLGAFTIVDLTTGARPSGLNDVYMRQLEDHSLGRGWPALSNAQRAASATDGADLHWVGPSVVAAAATLLTSGTGAGGHVRMFAPNPLQEGSSVAHFDSGAAPDQLLEPDYNGPTHGLGLTRHLLEDLGWTLAVAGSCGNGLLEGGEACDDGNTAGGDCCGATCRIEAAGTSCRAAASACDRAETCDGVSSVCPLDQVEPAGTTCRAAASVCDRAETCDGVSSACPLDQFAAAGISCRAAIDVCDLAEACDGVSGACPVDQFAAAGMSCRAATDVCDLAEACDGVSGACPVDQFAAAGMSCRAATDACDLAEVCDGASSACPVDQFAAAGISCRAATDVCDLAEACDGMTALCPSDQGVASGTECRPANGACDRAESCDGMPGPCPPDGAAPDGTPCSNGQVCDGTEICAAGLCLASMPLDCDDLDACTVDLCVEPGGCSSAPAPSCCNVDADCPAEVCMTPQCSGPGGTCSLVQTPGCCQIDQDCDDGVVCTNDRCNAGTCAFDTIPACCSTDAACDDGIPCTTDSCDEATGACAHVPLSGDGCCAAGVDCDDQDVCTRDLCNPITHACRNRALPNCCRDDSECGAPECRMSACEPATNTCSTPVPIPECCVLDSECDDRNGCTIDQCLGSACVATPIPGCGADDAGTSTHDAATSDAGASTDDAGTLADGGATITPLGLKEVGPVGCSATHPAQSDSPLLTILLGLSLAVGFKRLRRR